MCTKGKALEKNKMQDAAQGVVMKRARGEDTSNYKGNGPDEETVDR